MRRGTRLGGEAKRGTWARGVDYDAARRALERDIRALAQEARQTRGRKKLAGLRNRMILLIQLRNAMRVGEAVEALNPNGDISRTLRGGVCPQMTIGGHFSNIMIISMGKYEENIRRG